MVMNMRFNLMGIILMALAIWLGTIVGSSVASMTGFAGGLVGALVVGFVIYVIWALVTGQKIGLMNGVIFAVLVYLANIISAFIFGAVGIGGGIIGYFVTAVVLSLLVGWILRTPQAPVSTVSRKSRRKRRRR